ncbi:MAG: hypothetical protein EOO45_00415 [Flavobacterium sp.]|nr:MAG: hypothetical protein EOO45_00415 [Flavobacterium sp.]
MLHDNYSYSLSGMIELMVNDEQVRSEILERTFIKAWQEIDSYDAVNDSVFIWLVRLSIRVTAEHLGVPLAEMQLVAWDAYKEFNSKK